jgi:arylsulfatase A-like enzyme
MATQPNVIFIICDDLNDSIAGMGGHDQADTPNINRLIEKGVRFTNAHCNAPICGPSRASLWTGLLPSTSGYYGYNQQSNKWRQFTKLSDAITLMEHFKSGGYNVWGSGKIFHNGHPDNTVFTPEVAGYTPGDSDFGPFPWDGETFRKKADGTLTEDRIGTYHPDMPAGIRTYYGSFASLASVPTVNGYTGWSLKRNDFNYSSPSDRDRMPDEVTAEWVTAKLEATHDKPFLLVAGMNRPHTPMYVPDEFFEPFRDSNGNNIVNLPPYLENDLDDVPDILKSYSVGIDNHKNAGSGNNEWWKKFVQAYLASVAFVDHQVGTIIDAVETSNYADSTIIVFTSDHGFHLGEKDHKSKTSAWEETTRVPLVVYAPGVTQANQTCALPVSLIDLYPTLNALCGLPADPNSGGNNIALDGHDLSPLLANPSSGSWDGYDVSLSHLHGKVAIPNHTQSPWALNHHSVRSTDHHYVYCSDGSEELYDHTSDTLAYDPHEWINQANNNSYNSTKSILKEQLFEALGFKSSSSLIINGGFENGQDNWQKFGAAVSIANSNTEKYEQTSSVLVSDRNAPWNGIKQDLTNVLEPGKRYHFSAWVKLAGNADSQTIRLGIVQDLLGSETTYPNIDQITATSNAFSLIEGDYTAPSTGNGEINSLNLTVNGAPIGTSFYVDHVRCYAYEEPFIVASTVIDTTDGSVSLRWNADLGASYRMEQSLTLAADDWIVIDSNINADKTAMIWPVPANSSEQRVFWRIVKNS